MKSFACPPPQVLELRKGAVDQAKANFATSATLSPHGFEAFFNGGMLGLVLEVSTKFATG
jgi:hypothetical protein